MRRLTMLLTFVALIAAPSCTQAQEAGDERVYFSFLKVDFTDMGQWITDYQEIEVPIFESFAERGLISGFGLAAHDTGGEYNLRMAIVVPEWDALDDFWEAYFAELPEDYLASNMAKIRKHTDEIWVIADRAAVEDAPPPAYVYESAWNIKFDQLEAWTADFEQYAKPALQQAMDQGMITGWARLDHDTGPWNVKYVYWLTDWDHADELIAMMGEARVDMDPERMRAALAHSDEVWRSVPTTAGDAAAGGN
jgi:hypothetical protein